MITILDYGAGNLRSVQNTLAEIESDDGERFIHGHDEVSGAVDALAIAERFREKLAEHDADVLDGVMLIDIQIALRFQSEVKAAVFCEELQHMIEESNASGDFVAAAALDFQRTLDLRFLGDPFESR